jgi:hypothetical protein
MRQSQGSRCDYAEIPSYLRNQRVESGGYLVLVTWPKGPEQQLEGFASVEAARAWIEDDAPSWIAGSPYSGESGETAATETGAADETVIIAG